MPQFFEPANSSDTPRVPRRSAGSFIRAKKTGTKISTSIIDVPPTRVAAVGFITSEPTPVSHKMGTRLTNTTQGHFGLERHDVLYPFFGLLLSPMAASAAMTSNSVSVIANGLRLRSLNYEGE